MDNIFVRSKMGVEDLKKYLYYNQFLKDKTYIPLRIVISLVFGVFAAYVTQAKVIMFIVVTLVCFAALLLSPLFSIRNKYKHVYRKNKSGAFTQFQEYEFGKERFGFKSERDAEFDYTRYDELMQVAETKTLFIFNFSKKQAAVVVKEFASEEDIAGIRKVLAEKAGKKFIQTTWF